MAICHHFSWLLTLPSHALHPSARPWMTTFVSGSHLHMSVCELLRWQRGHILQAQLLPREGIIASTAWRAAAEPSSGPVYKPTPLRAGRPSLPFPEYGELAAALTCPPSSARFRANSSLLPSRDEAWHHSIQREMRTVFAFHLNQIKLGQVATLQAT